MTRKTTRLYAVLPAAMLLMLLALSAGPAAAQKGWLKDVAERALKRETGRQVDRAIAGAIRCAVGELRCYERAKARGEQVVFVDDRGEVIRDAQGEPVTDPANVPDRYAAASAPAPQAPPAAPDATTNVNYDFQAGERPLAEIDYDHDNIGDFPRQLELFKGNWDVVEWQGRRLLRNTGPRGAAFRIQLPSTLPEQFTIETEVYFPHTNQQMIVFFEEAPRGTGAYPTDRNYVQIAGTHSTGVRSHGGHIAESYERDMRLHKELMPIRVMADGRHVKVYVGEKRVANIPNANLPRTRVLQFTNTYFADEKNPMYLGPIRIMAGGRDLYDALATDGRVAVHDILFDTDAATIRAESATVLAEIGSMLQSHPELDLMIEGHTDSTGDFDHNMDLSRRRADSVKKWLVDRHGIAPAKLRTMGLGPTQPKVSNDDDAGRQQNRRVELVRI
jgi:outer membrane protein OmpA-like peptidoglycan-associated protein